LYKKHNKNINYAIIMSNQILVTNIKSWLTLDNEIKNLQRLIKEKRKEKKMYTQALVNIMKQNEIDAFDINDGKLLYTSSKTKVPLSKKHLIESVSKFFDNDENTTKKLCEFILNTRELKTKENIKRKFKK